MTKNIFLIAILISSASFSDAQVVINDAKERPQAEEANRILINQLKETDLSKIAVFVNGNIIKDNLNTEVRNKKNSSVKVLVDRDIIKQYTSDNTIQTIVLIQRLDTKNQDSSIARQVYDSTVLLGRKYYYLGDYRLAINTITEAIKNNYDLGLVNDRFLLACSYAMLQETDSSFTQLYRIAEKGNFYNYPLLEKEIKLQKLQEDSRWAELLRLVKMNAENIRKEL